MRMLRRDGGGVGRVPVGGHPRERGVFGLRALADLCKNVGFKDDPTVVVLFALFLLYGFMPNQLLNNSLTRSEVQALFGPAFTLERVVESLDRPGIPAAWYWLHRTS